MADDAPSGPDVFLSYAREDEARARELATALGQRGLSVFWDREIPPGQTWHSHIGRALAAARCVVVAWSRHSIASDWVIEEANEGKRRSILVPVLFETVPPPFGFGGIQGANLVDWHPDRPSPAFDGLLRAMQRVPGGQAAPGVEVDSELPRHQPAPSQPVPETKPSVGPATPSPAKSEPHVAPVRSSHGRARTWSPRSVVGMVAGLVTLASAGGIVWWLTQGKPSNFGPGESSERTEVASVSPPRASSAAAEPAEIRVQLKPMRDCPECPEMVLVPAGEFTMGSPPDEPGRDDDEGPQRTVTIKAPFWVSKYEVTSAEWNACAAVAECNEKGDGDSRPVSVNWNDAKAYVFWLSDKAGEKYRLLSEAEWEYVARARSTTAFWWGPGVGSDNANCNGCGGGWGGRATAPVGRFQANVFGLYDTAGNVWEWVEDCYHDNYESAPTDGAPRLDGECTDRVLRGGSWMEESKAVRSASRDSNKPSYQTSDYGFRVARTAD